MNRTHYLRALSLLLVFLAAAATTRAQVDIDIKGNAADRTRIAVANFKPGTPDPQTATLKRTFDTVLASDLANAGIFDLVSKSMAPQVTPGTPAEIQLSQWSALPVNAAMVAFGALGVTGSRLAVNGFLFDAKNPSYPQVLAKQYGEDASEDSARQIAHRFADEIILRLGGGINGIAETKIYYTHSGGGNKEIWEMDYDGANQHAVTHLGTISISPRVSPDNTRLAFASLGRDGFKIRQYSLLPRPHGRLPGRRHRHQLVPRLVARWQATCLLGLPQRRRRHLDLRRQRRARPSHHQLPRAGCIARLQPAHRRADRLDQRAHRACLSSTPCRPMAPPSRASPIPATPPARRGPPTASSSPSPGTANTAPALPAGRIST